jgi:predicted  nucleic acid-binding Zn-ribbon protein
VTSIAELYALQETDLALEAARTALADVESRIGVSEELLAAREKVAERQDEVRVAEKRFKEQEFQSDEVTRKIEPFEKKLYEGSVHNPKELEDLQKEIDSLKRRRSQLDDEALAAMEQVEEAQQALRGAQLELEELERDLGAEQVELHDRKEQLERELAELEARRVEQAPEVDGSLMPLYERLAAVRQGRAVAKVVGGACQGCRISLPMNLVQRARAGKDIVQCSSCERILYVT